jgi:hypothetical protein
VHGIAPRSISGAAMRRITSLYIGGPDIAFPGAAGLLQ